MITESRPGRRKPLYGVGVNDSDQVITYCPYYRRWAGVLARCYGVNFKIYNSPHYGCTVCEEWLTFTVFQKWMKLQDWKGKFLDKDMIADGNKVYGPDSCIFISQRLNSSIPNTGTGAYMRGVSLSGKKYQAKISEDHSIRFIGSYDTEVDAHIAYCEAKRDIVLAMPEVMESAKLNSALTNKFNTMVREALGARGVK